MDTPTISVEQEVERTGRTEVTVDLVQQPFEEQPAKIRIGYENIDAEERTVPFGASPPFSTYISVPENRSRLVIIPDDHDHISVGVQNPDSEADAADRDRDLALIPDEPVEECWKVQGDLAIWGTEQRVTLAPGETISEEYTVLNHPANRECFPSGEYRFVEEKYFENGDPFEFTIHV